MQLIAAVDDSSGTNTNLARSKETSTLKETDLTSCPAAVHDDTEEMALGIETQISTLTKSESECDVTEDGRDVELTCDGEPGRQVKTKDQERKAVVSKTEIQSLSPGKNGDLSNAAEDDRDVEITCDVKPGRQVKTKGQENNAVVSTYETQILPPVKSDDVGDTPVNDRALELATDTQKDLQVKPEDLDDTSTENRAAVDASETIILLTPGASASISDAAEDERIADLRNPQQTDPRAYIETFATPEKMGGMLIKDPEEQLAAFIIDDGELVIFVPAGPTGLQNGTERLEEIATPSVSPRQAKSKKGKKKKGKRRRN